MQVLYGSSSGLTATGSQVWSQDSAGVPGSAKERDYFGSTLAAGNFDGQHKADLAIGSPFAKIGSARYAGRVTVLYSSASKLTARGSQVWSQSTAGIPGTAEKYDSFGETLAAGNSTTLGRDDLVIGSPHERFSGRDDTGSVYVLRGTTSGLTATGVQVWTAPKLGAPTAPTTNGLGSTILAANFGRGSHGDLMIGSEGVFPTFDPPAYLLYGSATGFTPPQVIVGDGAAAADFNGDGIADLAGYDNVSPSSETNRFVVRSGSAGGLVEANPQHLSYADVNLPGTFQDGTSGLSAAGSL